MPISKCNQVRVSILRPKVTKNNRLQSFFDDQTSQYFVPSDTVFVGLCTGLLSAAAVSSSQSPVELIANALKTVKVAFRIGVKVNGVAHRLSRNCDGESNKSWSRLVVGAQKEASIAAVAKFNEIKVSKTVMQQFDIKSKADG